MFRKSKIEPVEKVKIVERYLAGEIGIQQAGKELGVDHHSIRNWISIYQYDGPTGLLNQPKNKSYSKDLKISAINDYLNGEGSLQDICTTLTFGTILDSQRKVNHILDTATIFRQRHSFLLSIILHVVKLYFKNSKSNKE